MKLHSKSFAKLNLCLHILGKRDDNFHNIESVFHMIDFYDEIDFCLRKDDVFNLSCSVPTIANESNLINKVFGIMKQEYSKINTGIDVYLKKNIPLASGLGGGSSNAAVAILAINNLYNLNLTKNDMMHIAENIGSDVPFFLTGGTAYITGRGEQVEAIDYSDRFFILIFPGFEVSTQMIYDQVKESDHQKIQGPDIICTSLHNSLEEIVIQKFPLLGQTKYWLSSVGRVRMSGTGSTLFIEYENYESARIAYKDIRKRYKSKIVSSLDSYDIFS